MNKKIFLFGVLLVAQNLGASWFSCCTGQDAVHVRPQQALVLPEQDAGNGRQQQVNASNEGGADVTVVSSQSVNNQRESVLIDPSSIPEVARAVIASGVFSSSRSDQGDSIFPEVYGQIRSTDSDLPIHVDSVVMSEVIVPPVRRQPFDYMRYGAGNNDSAVVEEESQQNYYWAPEEPLSLNHNAVDFHFEGHAFSGRIDDQGNASGCLEFNVLGYVADSEYTGW